MLLELANTGFGPFAIEFPKALSAQIVGIVLLIALFMAKVRPALSAMLNDRTARIQEAQEQVERALADTQRLHEEYASRLGDIEQEARQHIDSAVREAETVRSEIIAESQENANLIRRRAQEELLREQTRQRILLRRSLVQQTLDAAENSVTAFCGEAVQRQLIQEFTQRVSNANETGKGA